MRLHHQQQRWWVLAHISSHYLYSSGSNTETTRPYNEVFDLLTPFEGRAWRYKTHLVVGNKQVPLTYFRPAGLATAEASQTEPVARRKYLAVSLALIQKDGDLLPSKL